MKTRKFLLLLVFLTTALAVVGVSCKRAPSAAKPADVDYYTCTMHPSVKSQDPKGKCPICGMDLVPVMKKGGGEKQPGQMQGTEGMPGMPGTKPEAATQGAQTREFVVPVERQQQIGVTYAKVERKPLAHTIRSVGAIVPDRGRNSQFVSRVDGYVQKLHVTSPGEIVEKDAPLLSIYSPDLLTTEREFVELLRMRDEAKTKDARETPERLIDSAKQRVRLWNVNVTQMEE